MGTQDWGYRVRRNQLGLLGFERVHSVLTSVTNIHVSIGNTKFEQEVTVEGFFTYMTVLKSVKPPSHLFYV